MNEIKPMIYGEVEFTKISKKTFFDIVTGSMGDRFFLAKVEMITIDDNGVEKRKPVSILVQCDEIKDAMSRLTGYLQSLDCELVKLERSPILEVFRAVDSNEGAE